ncbi:hypothetical protein [Xanthocytophaga flava]|uniref:hypothetical protein n=1 Tax=Xanthocytophaga flava TaxID=3048013 RepID=UPI0028D04EAA|nr:hypothetical protein [Xanthocytophaga flavus]MDJ1473775.1 hypothetical protein [Xanthocytophaga flavus]
MEKEQLIELIRKIRFAEASSEQEADEQIMQLRENVPDPDILKYFKKPYEHFSPEEILSLMLSYKPIIL